MRLSKSLGVGLLITLLPLAAFAQPAHPGKDRAPAGERGDRPPAKRPADRNNDEHPDKRPPDGDRDGGHRGAADRNHDRDRDGGHRGAADRNHDRDRDGGRRGAADRDGGSRMHGKRSKDHKERMERITEARKDLPNAKKRARAEAKEDARGHYVKAKDDASRGRIRDGLKRHAEMEARLARLRELAEAKGDTDSVSRIDSLMAKEDSRHSQWLRTNASSN
jgi:hypothetical protein